MVITMKVYLNGNLYEGTADEIAEFFNLTNREQGERDIITESITTILIDGKVVNEQIHKINDEEKDTFLNIYKLSDTLKNPTKAFFTATGLKNCLTLANSNIRNCQYIKRDNCEIVQVIMKNDYVYEIDVSGDNLMVMAADVLKFMMYK